MRISYHLQVLLHKGIYDLAAKHNNKAGNFMVDDVENTTLDLKSRDNEFSLSYIDGGETHILNLNASTTTQLQRYYYFGDFEIDEELYYIPDIDFFKRLMRIIKHQVKPIKNTVKE
jgi:chemotaxis protein CheY-P-specific phosphatase CheC